MVTIRWLKKNEAPISAINKLLRQQSVSGAVKPLNGAELRECFENKNFHVAVAVDDEKTGPERVVGIATVFFQKNLGKWIAEIHDVVVDAEYRGRGIGRALTVLLIEKAKEVARHKQKTILLSLTSRPSRKEANQMYQSMGFEQIAVANGASGTNLYRMTIAL